MTQMMRSNPVMAPGLEINMVADGYIVYQPDRDRVHYLNQTAALVLELCNGHNAEADLPEFLRLAYDLPTPPVVEVTECLEALRKEGLIDADLSQDRPAPDKAPVEIALAGLRPFALKLHGVSDRVLSAHIRRYRVWEPLETAVIRAFLPEGGSLLDIGANLGWYTIVGALAVGENGMVFAFEPEPANFALLGENVRLNGLANVVLVEAAAADRDGEAILYLSFDNLGDHRLYAAQGPRRTCTVRTVSLDSYFGPAPPRFDVVKIDAQGSEARIFAGMRHTLAHPANRSAIIVTEFWPRGLADAGSSAETLLAELSESGRTALIIDENRKALVPIGWHELGARTAADLAPETSQFVNLLLLPSDRRLPPMLEASLPRAARLRPEQL